LGCAVLIAFSTSAYAQQPQAAPDAQQQAAKPATTTGTVKAYEAGKSIEIDAKGGPRTYDLTASDMTVTVSPDIKVGTKVKVTEKADSTGRKAVVIEVSGGTQ
jgi:hypothetical protein